MTNIDSNHGRERSDGVKCRRQWTAETPLSVAVVEAVAEATGRDPTEIEPLNEYIDPDALNDLFEPRSDGDRSEATVSFPLEDHLVIVRGDGTIVVRSPD